MAKDLHISVLLDYYGAMLTEKQREVVDLYYNEDLSLAEIAEIAGITRQGVRDSIKRGEMTLRELDDKLDMAKKLSAVQENLEQMDEYLDKIELYNQRYCFARPISEDVAKLREITAKLKG